MSELLLTKPDVLMSIRPHWCELIFSGKKTLEIRKSIPKLNPPFRVLAYCTSPKTTDENLWVTVPGGYNYLGNYHIIGEFVCPQTVDMRDVGGDDFERKSCLTLEDWLRYTEGHKGNVWGWEIKTPKLYPVPLTLEDVGLKRPPQSWQYVEVPFNPFQANSLFHRVGEINNNAESKGEQK